MAGFGGAGITLASISKYCCKKDPVSGQDTFRDCRWSCVLASISTLLVVVGASLATGNWPTEGAIGGLNHNNKRNIDYKNYTSINKMIENFNSIGLTVHDTWGNNYFEIGEKLYATNTWFRLHAPGFGPVANIYISPENSYLTTTHPNDHMNNPRNRKLVDYTERYDSSFWLGGGLITSYCRYNKGGSDLAAPKDTNIIFPAINSLQHIFTEVYGPYHWIINENNLSNRHIAEGVLSYSDTYDGTRPGFLPTGGIPSVCYGDHDEL
ncbi:hypothetical protein TPHA_0K02340 [Tetrapisispora phaffii CBS 4417]|uniref:Uncharacterized protein n=1 Tax=Tetrapisispora phaffii (strain ATCC 24235 / CBS 4417 / NBRC 1672 / NRRL Y-8282 / UCD 70-5) TaxID=1071381 RepID=G8BZN6_TETPH|nr:hypothetical protein TPHA_0K02340 [Tetrapisispora phaffii CBS 4417]CCE65364.1 hypothetical protein TPHA_0K02340 [Tetrapisispora phaffii CBS 4417]